ncbi:hypothetical protein Igag_0503 [Ignisphaera aggregans DSM 17230]|uniref:ArnR1-like winged helix-turn-helix domain-containing protein n=1 Tax=Ignisphaera aggregans (strain DSM 17230 / JCM 13409 / AQ1.S1) TaxID=583356 RepID=E0SRZ1_IGNAA|nr:hypothetical protein Igag_0503 [Ignisphaera aggregans DSM 17230]
MVQYRSVDAANSSLHVRRGSVEIIHVILKYLSESLCALKTHILYVSNLNSKTLEKYLNILLKNNIVKVDDHKCYMLTEKGYELLLNLENIVEILDNENDIDSMLIRVKARIDKALLNYGSSSIEIVIADDRDAENALKKVIKSYLLYATGRKNVYVLIPFKAYRILIDFIKYIEFLSNNVIPYEYYDVHELAERLKEKLIEIKNMKNGTWDI